WPGLEPAPRWPAGRDGRARPSARPPGAVSILVALLALVLVLAVIFVISRPLRRARAPERSVAPRRGELEALREAKYREIRDAELDYRMGKLSSEDYEL